MARTPSIGELRHRIQLCQWHETPFGADGIQRDRRPSAEVSAKVESIKPVMVDGFHVDYGDELQPTHTVVIRTPSDLHITSNWWVFHRTRHEKMWLKVLKVGALDDRQVRFTELRCAKREMDDARADPQTQNRPDDFERPGFNGLDLVQ